MATDNDIEYILQTLKTLGTPTYTDTQRRNMGNQNPWQMGHFNVKPNGEDEMLQWLLKNSPEMANENGLDGRMNLERWYLERMVQRDKLQNTEKNPRYQVMPNRTMRDGKGYWNQYPWDMIMPFNKYRPRM